MAGFERGGWRAVRLGRWLLIVGALMVLGPPPVNAFTLLGKPNVLSPGQIESLPFTLFGEQVTPRLDLDGFLRYQTVGFRMNGVDNGLMVPQLDLDFNLQLTASNRIHALFRPLERGFRRPTALQFAPNNTGWSVESSGEPARIWFEGQPLLGLSPDDSLLLDYTLAGGRVPLSVHNGIWFNNTFDGFAVSKNNIQVGNLSNLNLIYFFSRGQTDGGLTAAAQREARKNVMGLVAYADWLDYYWEVSWAKSYDNPRTARLPIDVDRDFWGISITRTFGSGGLSLRVLGSSANDSVNAGQLVVLEAEKELLGVRGYATVVGGTSGWLPVSQEGATLSRLGILFTFDRLTPFPGLNPRGSDSVGGVLGVIFKPRGIVTYTPEVGWLIDTSRQGNDQFGAALQVQADLASLLIPGTTLQETQRRGILYGALAILTLIAVRNQNNGFNANRDDLGGRLELIYRF